MLNDLISIIIPVYNASNTLKECLEAIFASNYSNYEVILIDDCSTDNSLEIANNFPCKIVKLSQKSGAAAARNKGAETAQGEIIFFIDSDIIITPNALSIINENFSNLEISGVVGLLSAKLRFKNFASQYKNLWMHYTYKILPDFVGVSYTSITAFRRNIFLELGGFDKCYKDANVEDTEFGQRFLTKNYKIYSDKRLEAEHIKHYTLNQVLMLDFKRSYELTMMFLRNFFKKEKQINYTSVPYTFMLSILFAYLSLLFFSFNLFCPNGLLIFGFMFSLLTTIFLNAKYLSYLNKINKFTFMLQSALFIPLDAIISGSGIIIASIRFVFGTRY
ncbi:MAG: glycosyltransferase family 2 protein [bacterium]|nr:glycosyltransferase family 2 protein [bacterium]